MKKVENENTENVFEGWEEEANETFLLDSGSGDEDVFNLESMNSEAAKPKKPVKIKKDVEEGEDIEEEEEEDLLDFNAEEEEEEEEGEGEDTEEEEEEDTEGENKKKKPKKGGAKLSNLATIEYLKEKGLVEFEVEEGEELSEEDAEGILEDSFEARLDAKVAEMHEDLPPLVKQLNKYTMKGGNPEVFLQSYLNNSTVGDVDIEQESGQMALVKEKLTNEGLDAEDIEAQLEFYKDSGKLKKFAERYLATKEANREAQEQEVLARQAEENHQIKLRQREFKKDITGLLKKSKELNGIPLTKADIAEMPGYMSDRSVQLESGNQITGMQRDLVEALKDKEKTAILAKLLRTNFNFDSITKKAASNTVKKIKTDLTRTGKTKIKKRQAPRSLADLL